MKTTEKSEDDPVSMGTLFLVPTRIADCEPELFLPAGNAGIIRRLKLYFVENERSARRFISGLKLGIIIEEIQFEVLDKDTDEISLRKMAAEIKSGKNAGLMSEAGNPGIADPGSKLVALAHKSGIIVRPLVGPSSILMALISSGFNGQNFAFSGYLPIDGAERKKKIRELEARAYGHNETQVIMETPYRNDALMKDLVDTLKPGTLVCVAADLTGPAEMIRTMPVQLWREQKISLNKIPAVFLIYHP
ncbi:MAG TPA: SAM-dependent methyltransferase [Cyclobacteriaceae bacterium]|nr:SAM-dependent methyltransferase [Cyclobacteriaceae bacterium]